MSAAAPEPGGAADRLTLADWRRQVAGLYTVVRDLAAEDPVEAWQLWREVRERLYRSHPQSPVPPGDRARFAARYWPYQPALRFELRVAADDAAVADGGGRTVAAGAESALPSLRLPVSSGGQETFDRIGFVDVPFEAGARRLGVYWMRGYAGGLFVPFRDATNGSETYGAGRYALDGAKSADLGGDAAAGTIVVDFNFAYHPSCAFDPRWSCPLAPPENRLDLRIEAGERLR